MKIWELWQSWNGTYSYLVDCKTALGKFHFRYAVDSFGKDIGCDRNVYYSFLGSSPAWDRGEVVLAEFEGL